MNKTIRIFFRSIFFFLAAILFSSCATQRYIPSAGQKVIRTKGSFMVLSIKKNASIAITALNIREGKARFVFSIANRTNAPFVVYPSQISATDESGRKAKIFSAQEMESQAGKRADKMAAAVARNASNQSLQASTPVTIYQSGSVDTPYSQTTYSGVSTILSPAQVAARQQIDTRASNRMVMIGERLSDDLKETRSVFKTAMIFPNKPCSALLVVKVRREIHFNFIIANEIHEAHFVIKK